MRAVAVWPFVAALAAAEPDSAHFRTIPGYGLKSGAFMRSIAKGLFLGAPASTPIVGLSGLDRDLIGPGLRHYRIGHADAPLFQ